MCDDVARAPAADRPLFTATIGFVRADAAGDAANRRGFPNDSRYSRITSVSSSVSQYWRRSLPGDVRLVAHRDEDEMPSPSGARSRSPPARARRSATRKPTRPARRERRRERGVQPHVGRGVEDAHAVRADQPHAGLAADARPARAGAQRPRSPISAKPAEITTSARTPFGRALAGRPRARAPPGRRSPPGPPGPGSSLHRLG